MVLLLCVVFSVAMRLFILVMVHNKETHDVMFPHTLASVSMTTSTLGTADVQRVPKLMWLTHVCPLILLYVFK